MTAQALDDPVDPVTGQAEDRIGPPVGEALDQQLRRDLRHKVISAVVGWAQVPAVPPARATGWQTGGFSGQSWVAGRPCPFSLMSSPGPPTWREPRRNATPAARNGRSAATWRPWAPT